MRRVLMIHYNFPPLGGVASVRAAKVARYLEDFGWSPVIVAPNAAAYHEDLSLGFPSAEVIRTTSLEWAKTAKRVTSPGAANGGRRSRACISNLLRRLVHRVLYVPDAQMGWYPFALRAAREVLRERRVDVLFSSSPPVSAHLIARRLQTESGLPWIAEFRDLWTDWRWNGPWRQKVDERIEASIVKSATAVVTVSPTYAAVLRDRGARSVCTITNGFDPADFSPSSASVDDVLTYVGTYYPQSQDLGTILNALSAVKRAGQLTRSRLQIVGDLPGELARLISEADLSDFVESTGFVSHEESIRRILASRALLLAGSVVSPEPALRGHIPGKTFEYLGSGKPIIFAGDLASDVAELLRPFPQVRMIAQGDTDAARAALLSLEEDPHRRLDGLEPFAHRGLSERLARYLTEVA
jgi:glycosyltransferase involved in cell wall biosynthesis